MVLPVIHQNNVKIYNVSGYNADKLPEWILAKHKKKLKKDPNFASRIELIQNFEFPQASNRIKISANEKFIVATGVYKPQIRVFDLDNLSLKFERHTNSENIQFLLLDEDYSKLVLLQADRSLEFHTQGGIYYSTRIPKAGRDLIYDQVSCDLLCVGSGSQVFRLNLEQGRFLQPLETQTLDPGINCAHSNPQHRLYAFGSQNGCVQYWDPRYKKAVGQVRSLGGDGVSALNFLPNGLTLTLGTETGSVLVFDLRHSEPYLSKEHQYGYPIKNLSYHSQKNLIASVDLKIVKFWDKDSGSLFASVESEQPINDFCLQQNTGFFVLANEDPQMQSFFIPSLSPAPKWCSFLENLTEELQQNPQPTVYDNYKFLTRAELGSLGLEHLIGSNLLRAYMHGYFIDYRLYQKAKAISNPFQYEEYKKAQIQQKIEKETSTRISSLKNLPKTNKKLAIQLATSAASNKTSALVDQRFKQLFVDPDFEVDETSKEYKTLHPNQKSKPTPAIDSLPPIKNEPDDKDNTNDDTDDDSDY